jgi:hypothetical protein
MRFFAILLMSGALFAQTVCGQPDGAGHLTNVGGCPSGLAGGSVGQLPVQTAAGTTGYVSGNVAPTPYCLIQKGDGTNPFAPAWKPCPVFGGIIEYFTNTASDISTYLQQTPGPYTPQTAKVFSSLTGTGTTTLQNWGTNSGDPGVTFLPAGTYQFHVHALKSGTGTLTLQCQFWEVSALGVDIAMIGVTNATPALTTTLTEYQEEFSDSNVYTMSSAASRVVARVQAVRTGVGAGATLTIDVGGDTDSHIQLP